MMRPSNFPERKNQRRIGALVRIQDTLSRKSPGCWMELSASEREAKRVAAELHAYRLGELIQNDRRSVRTKKAGGHIERLARARSTTR